MAVVALNKFRTIRKKVTTTNTGIYTCPIGVAAIITLCQATNVSVGSSASAQTISGIHSRPGDGFYYFAFNQEVPVNDSMNLIPDGRLVLETNDVISIRGSENNNMDLIMSILETAKQ
jgi:hypothetical protein